MVETPSLAAWAQAVIGLRITSATRSLDSYCRKPRSAKRLHHARKELARLRAALEDLAAPAGATREFIDCIDELHARAGKVRDADVLLARLDEYCETAAADEKRQLHTIRAALRKRRKRARRKFERTLSTLPELRL